MVRPPRRVVLAVLLCLCAVNLACGTQPDATTPASTTTASIIEAGPVFDVVLFGDSYIAGDGAYPEQKDVVANQYPDNGYFFRSSDDPRPDQDVVSRELPPNPDPAINRPLEVSRGCFRNHHAYGEVAFRDEGSKGKFINASCAGGVNADLAKQAAGLSEKLRAEINLVVVSTGGNDAKFTQLVVSCVLIGDTGDGSQCSTTLAAMGQNLSRVTLGQPTEPDEGVSSKKAIRDLLQQFPNATFIWVGYPDLDERERTLTCNCPGGQVKPAERIRVLNEQGETLQRQAVAELNDELRQQPRRQGQPAPPSTRLYFQSLRGVYEHHNIGSEDPWIHQNDPNVEWHQWYHPTYEGNRQTAKLLRQSDGWRQAVATAPMTR